MVQVQSAGILPAFRCRDSVFWQGKAAIALEQIEIFIKEQKKFTDPGKDTLGELASGLSLLVLFQHAHHQVLPLFL